MKKVLKIVSPILAVIMILSIASTAFADSYNTVQTAQSIGIGTTYTTFKYGYPDGTSKSYVAYTQKYFSFVPSTTGYYEFAATGYESTEYAAGKTPSISFTISNSAEKTFKTVYYNSQTLETRSACELTAGQVYYINLTNFLSGTAAYNTKKYVEQTIGLTVSQHSHTLRAKAYGSYNYIECMYCNYSEKFYNVAEISSVKLSKSKFTYNGKVQAPTVIAYNTNGDIIDPSSYTTSIGGNKKSIGKYSVNVTFSSDYKYQTYSFTYTIVPKGTSVSKLSANKKGFTVKWKKQKSNTSGYVVRYSTSSKMKNAKKVYVSGNGKTSKSISNLKKGKKYYVQVATYKTVKGKKIVSNYSKAKAVKTK